MRTIRNTIASLLLLLAFTPGVRADVTWVNCNAACSAAGNQISWFDTNGNAVDAHDGQFFTYNSRYYLIGTAYNCGYRYGTAASLFCGFRVYDVTDFENPVSLGFIFDATGSTWQTNCKDAQATPGCFRPHIIYNAANNNWVLWFNIGGTPIPGAPTDALYVFTCTTPVPSNNCTQQTNPTGLAFPPSGDFGLFVDTGGVGYIVYSTIAPVTSTREIYIDQLNANYTDSTGTSVDTGVGGPSNPVEAPAMFLHGSTYYVMYSVQCAYCTSAAVSYVSASSPLGTYGSPTQVNASACEGQFRSVDVIGSNYLLSSDLWTGNQNQAIANTYLQPLSFSGSSINSFSCNQTVTLAGLSTSGNYPTPNSLPGAAVDQSDLAYGVFNARSDINNGAGIEWAQTFVPAAANLYAIRLPIGIGYPYSSANCQAGTGTCPASNGTFDIDLVPVTGTCAFGSVIASATVAASSLTWGEILTTFVFNQTLTPSSTYAFIMRDSTGSNNGSLNTVLSQGPSVNAYPSGQVCYSSNGGSTWSASAFTNQNKYAFMFQTLSVNAVPGRWLFR